MPNGSGALNKDWYFIGIVVISIIYFASWILMQNNYYANFHSGYYDLGVYAYTTYMHLGGAHYTNALQYIVFAGHLLPFMVLVLPIFVLYPQPITLIAIQEMFLALTTILVYMVSKSIAKNKKIGFAFAFAFMISPMVMGLVGYDFHSEAFIPFFYVLSFYFYSKSRIRAFAFSYFGLLCISEFTFVFGLSLLFTLFLYGYIYDQNKKSVDYKQRQKLLGIGLALSILAALFYYFGAAYIVSSYSSTSYVAVPPPARLIEYVSSQVTALTNQTGVSYTPNLYSWGAIGVLVIFLQFGITSLVSPILSLILCAPWLGEVFVLHNGAFPIIYFQYYGFIIGGSYVAAMLGYRILADAKVKSKPFKLNRDKLDRLVFSATMIASYSILLTMLPFTFAANLIVNQASVSLTSVQIGRALLLIPANASVMTQSSLAPHLFYIRDLELSPLDVPSGFVNLYSVFWLRPDYIVLDSNFSDYGNFANTRFNVYSYMSTNYTLVYSTGGLQIYELKQNRSG